MADSTSDPLSMDTVGSRGRWVAAARPGPAQAVSLCSGRASAGPPYPRFISFKGDGAARDSKKPPPPLVPTPPPRPCPPFLAPTQLCSPRQPTLSILPAVCSPSTMEATRSQMQEPS